VGLERGPLSLVRVSKSYLNVKASAPVYKTEINGRGYPLRWPLDTLSTKVGTNFVDKRRSPRIFFFVTVVSVCLFQNYWCVDCPIICLSFILYPALSGVALSHRWWACLSTRIIWIPIASSEGRQDSFRDSTISADHEFWMTGLCTRVYNGYGKWTDCMWREADLVVPRWNLVHTDKWCSTQGFHHDEHEHTLLIITVHTLQYPQTYVDIT
jgi:hypothetical protein